MLTTYCPWATCSLVVSLFLSFFLTSFSDGQEATGKDAKPTPRDDRIHGYLLIINELFRLANIRAEKMRMELEELLCPRENVDQRPLRGDLVEHYHIQIGMFRRDSELHACTEMTFLSIRCTDARESRSSYSGLDYPPKSGSSSPTIGYYTQTSSSSTNAASGAFLSPSQSISGLFGAGTGSMLASPPSPAASGGSPALHAPGAGALSLLQVCLVLHIMYM